jgi:hypothetical protein
MPENDTLQQSNPPQESNPTDVAALAAAVITVVVTALAGKEPYGILGAGVGLTTALIMFGYVWRRKRSLLQSVAFASLIGGVAIPIVCWALEWSRHPGCLEWSWVSVRHNPCMLPDFQDQKSLLSDYWPLVTWLIVGVVTLAADIRFQANRPKA